MSDNHTPGPWTSGPTDDATGIVDADGWRIASVYLDHSDDPVATAFANRDLIAAAPDLLEACRLALDEISSCGFPAKALYAAVKP